MKKKKIILTVSAILIVLVLLGGVLFFCLRSSDTTTDLPDVPTLPSTPSSEPSEPGTVTSSPLPTTETPSETASLPDTDSPVSTLPTAETEPSTQTPYSDPDFDLIPTGRTTEQRTAEDVFSGSLVLAGNGVSFDPASAKGLINSYTWKYGEKRATNLCLGSSTIQVNSTAMDALGAMQAAMDAELGTEKYIILNAGYMTEEEILASNADEKHTYTVNDDPKACEHGTGYAVNINFWDGKSIFYLGAGGVASETEWLKNNAARFGFIERYPKTLAEKTGHAEETGHFRYVGIPHATYMAANHMSLEEYTELIRQYTIDEPLRITDYYGYTWSVCFTAANAEGNTAVCVPVGVKYEISGNNCDGFVVTVKSPMEELPKGEQEEVPVSGVQLKEEELTVQIGQSYQLRYTVAPVEATDRRVIFESSSEDVLKVTSSGRIAGCKAGESVVTVRTLDGTFIDSVKVIVAEKPAEPDQNEENTLDEKGA